MKLFRRLTSGRGGWVPAAPDSVAVISRGIHEQNRRPVFVYRSAPIQANDSGWVLTLGETFPADPSAPRPPIDSAHLRHLVDRWPELTKVFADGRLESTWEWDEARSSYREIIEKRPPQTDSATELSAREAPTASICPDCGRPIAEHDRHVRFALPDPVLEIPPADRADRTWGKDPIIQVQGVGAFVRVLLPIGLTAGYTLTVGTWLGIDPSELRSVWERWETDEYAALRLDGGLANAIPPWGKVLLAAPATATVREQTLNPYISASDDALLAQVIGAQWPHAEIRGAYEDVLQAHGPHDIPKH